MKKSPTVGYILAFFLGGIGAHAFYYGKYVKGILYLLFSWTAIPILLAWRDMLYIKLWQSEYKTKQEVENIYRIRDEKITKNKQTVTGSQSLHQWKKYETIMPSTKVIFKEKKILSTSKNNYIVNDESQKNSDFQKSAISILIGSLEKVIVLKEFQSKTQIINFAAEDSNECKKNNESQVAFISNLVGVLEQVKVLKQYQTKSEIINRQRKSNEEKQSKLEVSKEVSSVTELLLEEKNVPLFIENWSPFQVLTGKTKQEESIKKEETDLPLQEELKSISTSQLQVSKEEKEPESVTDSIDESNNKKSKILEVKQKELGTLGVNSSGSELFSEEQVVPLVNKNSSPIEIVPRNTNLSDYFLSNLSLTEIKAKIESTGEKAIKKVESFKSNYDNLSYDEDNIILPKYRHIETPQEIFSEINKIKSAGSGGNYGEERAFEGRYPWIGRRFISRSLIFANKRGVESPMAPLMEYWTTFDSLNSSQKKWYFYWREQILKGEFLDTDLSYVILFAYELLNYSFNQKAAFNISMMVQLHENYLERLPKVKSYLGLWIGDLLKEVGENDLSEEWSYKEVYQPPLYKELINKQNELYRIFITKWKPYVLNYKETIFFSSHKNKIYKIFKESIPILQNIYLEEGQILVERYFETKEEREVKHLFSSAVIGREIATKYIQSPKIIPTIKLTNEATALFRLSENVARLILGNKNQIKVEEEFLPYKFKELMLKHFNLENDYSRNRFQVVAKPERKDNYGEIPKKPLEPVEKNTIPNIKFDWDNIKVLVNETEELINVFKSKDEEIKLEKAALEKQTIERKALISIENQDISETLNNKINKYIIPSTIRNDINRKLSNGKNNRILNSQNESNKPQLQFNINQIADLQSETDNLVELMNKNDSNEGEVLIVPNTESSNISIDSGLSDSIDVFTVLSGTRKSESQEEFLNSLNNVEKQFLLQFDNGIYKQNDAKQFLKQKGIMLGNFLNEINEKSNEFLGDNLLEIIDDEISVYEEYGQIILDIKETI